MSKSYSVRFDILGSIDPSLLQAIKSAQDRVNELGKLNGKALAQTQKLTAANKKLGGIKEYKSLTRAVQGATKARAAELLVANRSLVAHKEATQQLEAMQKAYRGMQAVQRRLMKNAQVQRGGLPVARAYLREAKKSGDINRIQAEQAALFNQQDSARRAAEEVKKINAALRQGRSEIKAQKKSIKELDNTFAQSSARAQELKQQLAYQNPQLNQLRTNAPQNLGQVETHLRAEIQQTTNALNREIAAIERRNQILNNFSTRQHDLFNAYSNFQGALDTANSIMTPFKNAADNAQTFEFAMSQVKALTSMQNIRGGNLKQVEKDMAALTAQAEKLGATTEFTATEVADAMKYYGYAGWNSQQIQAVMNQTVDMASVTGKHNIARMADIFSDDLTILGIKAGDQIQLAGGKMVDAVTHTFDNYSYAITKANLDEEALHTSLTYNAPAMLLAGLTQGEIFAANMISANSGLKGSTSGTALRTGWIRMLAPAKKGAKALEELGLTATESQKQMAAASEAFAQMGVTEASTARERLMALKNAWDENERLGEEGRSKNAAMLDAIIGKNAFSTWANLFKGNNLQQMMDWADYMDRGETAGWTADTAAVMRDNTKTQIELLKSSIDALEKAAGDALLPTIRGAANLFAPLITSAAQWVAQNPGVVQACAAIATAISTATVAVAGFSLAMAGVRFAQAGFATAGLLLGDLTSKIAAAAAILRGLTFANIGATLSSGLSAAANAGAAFGAAMLNAARAALAFVFTPVGAALTAIAIAAFYAYNNWERISAAISHLSNIFNSILPAIDNAKNALASFAQAANLDSINNAVSTLINGFGSTLVGAIITAAGIISTALNSVIVFVLDLHSLLTDAATSIVNIFKAISEGDLSGIGDALKKAISTLGDDLNQIGSNFISNITEGLSATNAALETYLHPAPTVQSSIQAGLDVMPASFDTTAAQGNIDALASSAQNAASQMQGLDDAGTSIQAVSTAAQTSTEGFTTAGENAVNAGTQFQTAGDTAAQAVGGLQSVNDGASAVAGALSAKAAEISAIHISVPQVNLVPMNIPVPTKHLASGGIFPRGEFLTTFAENSAEAAIPLDKSSHAINLWQQAGAALGVFSNKKTAHSPLSSFNFDSPDREPLSINITVNVAGNADESTVRRGVEQALPRVRSFAQELADYRHELARRAFS